MYKDLTIIVFLFSIILVSCAQHITPNYQGEWVGFLPDKHAFNFHVSIEELENDRYHLIIRNDKILIDKQLASSNKDGIQFDIDQQLFFNLTQDQNNNVLAGFIKTGRFLYHISFPKIHNNTFAGPWNPFMVDKGLQSDDILLYMEHTEEGGLVAYPFLGDQRFRGTWTEDFRLEENTLLFRDGNTGFNLRASLLGDKVDLEFLLCDAAITEVSLTHTTNGWEYNEDPIEQSPNTDTPPDLKDGWTTANLAEFGIRKEELLQLIDSIHARKLVNTHSVLIAKENKLVFESYFDGFHAHIPHDLRSASKSISSAMIGIAIQDGYIKSVDEKLYDCIPEAYHYTKDSLKAKISIEDLLTMRSGLEVNKGASENTYQDPSNSNSWLQTVLEAPMVHEPGSYADYGSANPFLLGVCLNERLDMPLDRYIDEKLFAPLGITNYINQTDDAGTTPYFGGGMMLTSRDLLKFGQLYLDKGRWKGKQIIPEHWVEASFKKHARLQDVRDKNAYGYQWWHDSYLVKGKSIQTIEARGAGGQFIFIIPSLESVVVITSGNFRNRKGNQPRDILKAFILPAMIDE